MREENEKMKLELLMERLAKDVSLLHVDEKTELMDQGSPNLEAKKETQKINESCDILNRNAYEMEIEFPKDAVRQYSRLSQVQSSNNHYHRGNNVGRRVKIYLRKKIGSDGTEQEISDLKTPKTEKNLLYCGKEG